MRVQPAQPWTADRSCVAGGRWDSKRLWVVARRVPAVTRRWQPAWGLHQRSLLEVGRRWESVRPGVQLASPRVSRVTESEDCHVFGLGHPRSATVQKCETEGSGKQPSVRCDSCAVLHSRRLPPPPGTRSPLGPCVRSLRLSRVTGLVSVPP